MKTKKRDDRIAVSFKSERSLQDRLLIRITGAYFLLSVFAAQLVSLKDLDLWLSSELMGAIPTVNTLVLHGNLDHVVVDYFFVMTMALPVTILLLLRAYSGAEFGVMSLRRRVGSLIFFLGAAALVSVFVFMLPTSYQYQGTRIRVLIYLAANHRLGLGSIMGVLFVSLALLATLASRAALSLATSTHQQPTRNQK